MLEGSLRPGAGGRRQESIFCAPYPLQRDACGFPWGQRQAPWELTGTRSLTALWPQQCPRALSLAPPPHGVHGTVKLVLRLAVWRTAVVLCVWRACPVPSAAPGGQGHSGEEMVPGFVELVL